MPCSPCQQPSNWVSKQAFLSAHSGKPGWGPPVDHPGHHLKDTLNQEDLDILAPSHLHQHHSTSAIKGGLCEWQDLQHPLNERGWCPSRTPGHHTKNEALKHCRKTKAKGSKNYDQPHPHHLCPHQIMGLKVTQSSVSTSSMVSARSNRSEGSRHLHHGLTMPQRVQRPYENQPASLQGWGHDRHCHIPNLALGLKQCIIGLGAGDHTLSLLCYLFPIRIPGGVGKKFGDRCHSRWCTHYTGWSL